MQLKSCLLSAALLAASAGFSAELKYAIVNDRTNLIYRVGEEATFKVMVTEKGGAVPAAGEVQATLDNFGPHKQLQQTFDLARGNVFSVKGKLDAPGFLRLTLKAKDTEPKTWSVGYDPEKIRKGSPSPRDFDAFWSAAKAKLAKEVPLDAQMTKVPERSTKNFDFYRISFATFGRRVYGYMSVPTDRAKAPFPVVVSVSAAGFGDWTNDMRGEADRIRVSFFVFPWEPHWKWKEMNLMAKYEAMNAECNTKFGSDYSQAGMAVSREAYYFYPVILGIDRAVDWIAKKPYVDRQRFCYSGTSQGGGFGLYLTGLNRTFTKAALFVPAMTDTMGYLKERRSGWPGIVERYSSRPELKAVAEKNAPYFDGANFAARIRCPVRVAVGFADTTCAPCAVYAAYNAIAAKDKGIVHGIGMPHSCFGAIYEEIGNWLRK